MIEHGGYRVVIKGCLHIFEKSQPNPFYQIAILIPYQNIRMLNIDMTIRPFINLYRGADLCMHSLVIMALQQYIYILEYSDKSYPP